MGVIDSKNGIYSGYGEITLIPKAEKIAKRTGKNIGTYAADAWTPIYPSVEKKFGGKGGDVAYNDIESVPKEMQRLTRNAIDGFMDGRDADGLAYLYLHEKGKAPGLAHVKGKYPKELHDEVRNILGKSDGLYDTDDEQKSKLLDLFIREVYDGNRDEFDNDTRMILEKTEAFIKKRPNSILAKDKQMDVDWIKEHGYDYGTLARFVDGIQRDAKTAGKVDDNATMSAAQKYVKDNGLKEDFESWKEKLNDRYNVEEVIFAGYKSDGTRKYLPNTLENAVKVMKADGRNASVGSASFSHFVASILKPMGTLDQIRKKKGNLTGNYDDVEKFQEKWQPVYEELADKMQPDASPFESYGMDRLEETASQKNPKKYAKEEYGVDLTDEDIKKMDELVDAIKNDKPSVYFETKFMRPYGLDEFDKAIVPKDTPQDVVDALKKAGIDVRTYDGKEDREKVTMEAVNDSDDIRFSLREVNDRFNEQLSEFTIEDADKFIFNLGRPSAKLKAAGVTDRPIRLNGSKLAKKIKKHGFEPNELKNLPMAMEDPIAVFDNLGREGNRSVLTELKTANGNFLVSIDLGKGSDADFDVVSSVFGKRGNSILTWINKGFLKYVDKEKALNYLHLSAPIAEASDNSELSTAAKIVKDFENPNISEGKKFSIRTYHGSGADFDHFDKEGDARIVDHTKFSLRGNKGYVGNSKSVRAVDAENRGLRPKSRIDADFVDEVRAIVKERTGSDSKITLKDVREIADKVKADEWHHTGVTFNRTDYYSPESIADYITSEDDDRTESLRSKYDDISDQMSQISNELMPAIRKKAFDGKGNFVASNGLEVEANVNDVIRGEAYHPRVESTQEFNKYGVGEYVYYSDLPSLPQNLKDEYQTAVSEYNNHVKQVRKSMSDEFSTYDALGEERNRIQGEMNSIGMPKFSLREGQTSLPERVSQYDNENGTEVERFFAFLDRGRSLEKGEKPIFHVGNSGDVLQQYGIKGNIYVSTRTVSPYRHTKNADHGLTSEEWMNALESMNEPLAITKYGEDGNGFRIYTHAVKNGKSVCLGVDVKTLDNGVEITDVTDIKTAFGRDIEKAIRNEEILYPEGEDKIEKIRRNFAQSSPTHNSQVYEQSSVSGANIDNTSETSKENGEKNTSEPKFSLRQSYDDRLSDWKKRNGLAPDEKPMDKPVRGQNESIGDFMVRMADYAKNAALWKTAPRPSGYMEALEQWKKDNGIPADEYRPAVPRKADYATDDEYQKARDQYKQEMDKWKGAPKASDYDLSVDLDGMAGKLTAITSAMLNQRSFDRQTIDGIVEMVKTMLALGWGDSPMRDLRESRIITPNFERTKRRRAGLSTGHAF